MHARPNSAAIIDVIKLVAKTATHMYATVFAFLSGGMVLIILPEYRIIML